MKTTTITSKDTKLETTFKARPELKYFDELCIEVSDDEGAVFLPLSAALAIYKRIR